MKFVFVHHCFGNKYPHSRQTSQRAADAELRLFLAAAFSDGSAACIQANQAMRNKNDRSKSKVGLWYAGVEV